MGYDPKTGEWKDEDTSVSKRLVGLLNRDNEYLKSAGVQGLKAANRRGLANSTMAVSAVESSRINAALPIASQEASQAHERYLSGRQQQGAEALQTKQLESNKELLGLELGSRKELQQSEIQNQQWLAQFDATTQERLLTLDNDTRLLMQQLDLESQQRIATMNVAASERNQAAALAASFEASYSNMLAAIMNNTEIPAASRQQYIAHAARVRDSNLALVEQMYGIDLQWENPGDTTGGSDASQTGSSPGTTTSRSTVTARPRPTGKILEQDIDGYGG